MPDAEVEVSRSRRRGPRAFFGRRGRPTATITDAAGRFSLRGIDTEPVSLQVRHPRFAPKEQLLKRMESGEVRRGLRITLSAGGFAAGRVVDGDGTPLAGANVEALESGGRMPFRNPDEPPLAQAVTGADGSFLLEGLEPGRVEVRAQAPGYARSAGDKVRIALGETTTLPEEIVLRPGRALQGRVIDRHGVGIAEAHVATGLPPFGMGGESTTTDLDGRFTIADLDPDQELMLTVMSSQGGPSPEAGGQAG